MRLIVGLGNPGREHEKQRHNIGFMAVDEIAHRHNFPPFQKKHNGLISTGRVGSQKFILLKPTTYMNNSGQSVGAAMRYFDLEPDDVTIIYDELDLVPGKMRIKTSGGHGGHNGLRSIDAHIGKDYQRVRLGIGHPGNKALVTRHVLGDFAKADNQWREPLLEAIAQHVEMLLNQDISSYMNAVALAVNPNINQPKPKPKGQSKLKSSDTQKSDASPKVKSTKPATPTKSAEGPLAAKLKSFFAPKGDT